MRSWLALLVLVALVGSGERAAAQAEGSERAHTERDDTELARAEFERGRAAYESGDFEASLSAFQRAHELTGDPQILFNVATVADRLRRDALALQAYEGYLAGYPEAPDRANVEARIAAIRQALAVMEPEPEPEPVPIARPEPEPPASSRASEGGLVLAVTGGVLAAAGAGLLIAAAIEADLASRAETWAELMGPYERVPLVSAAGIISLGLGVAIAALGVGWLIMEGGGEQAVAVRLGPGNVSLEGSF